ncbi:MAG: cytochrome c peroxidase [candidate division NC10 bacterium]|nr:cytochrome c peroxidase [candidate division NC10 bacterium]
MSNDMKGNPRRRRLFILGLGLLGVVWVYSSLTHAPLSKGATAASDYTFKIPLGVIDPEVPEDNPMSAAKVELGRQLYFDKRLSVDDTVSCATCHDPKMGFAENKKVSTGIQEKKGNRNSPTTLNAALYDLQFWDGRAASLEEQAKGPIVNPVEMGMPSLDVLVEKLKKVPEYQKAFGEVFGGITADNIVKAIAAYERTLLAGDSPFDRYFYGKEENAISESAKRGLEVFRGSGRCVTCHEILSSFALFTDNKFHNVGVGMDKPNPDLGRFEITKEEKDTGAFKTPNIRNVALTAPYMHDGSEPTLEAVVELYNKGGIPNRHLDGGIQPLNLTEQEKQDLVEFMKTLTTPNIDKIGGPHPSH